MTPNIVGNALQGTLCDFKRAHMNPIEELLPIVEIKAYFCHLSSNMETYSVDRFTETIF